MIKLTLISYSAPKLRIVTDFKQTKQIRQKKTRLKLYKLSSFDLGLQVFLTTPTVLYTLNICSNLRLRESPTIIFS